MFNKKQKGIALRNSKGFTLIELLVVIAIIGLLAGIVLVSLSGARDSAKNARIQAGLAQTKALAELIYNGSTPLQYNGLCPSGTALNSGHATYGTQLDTIATEVLAQHGTVEPTCWASGGNYCISADMVGGGNPTCISSTGRTGNDYCIAATTLCTPP